MVNHYSAFWSGAETIDTGGGGRKHAAITSKGVVWFGIRDNGNLNLFTVPSLGVPGYQSGDSQIVNGGLTCGAEWSMFIDSKDDVHIVYAKYQGGSSDGRTDKATIMYRHGVLSSTHTAITWSAEVALTGYDYWHCPDLVAVHDPTANKTYAHLIWSYNWAGDNRVLIMYGRVRTNAGDSVNYTVEAAYGIHDISGSQTFVSKPSIDFRHNGDGKTPYRNAAGALAPDIFMCWTQYNSQQYAARFPYTSSGSWTDIQIWLMDGNWGVNTVSGGYGGLYEHHRWARLLYDRRDDRVLVVGWVATNAVARQALVLWEWAARGSTANLVATGFTDLDWGVNTVDNCISGDACLIPDSNIEVFSNVGTPWYDRTGRRRIVRPAGSNTRTVVGEGTAYETLHSGGNTAGSCGDLLPYPPAGEHHAVSTHANGWFYYWRNNRGANHVHTGSGVARRPKYRLHPDGVSLVPEATRAPPTSV